LARLALNANLQYVINQLITLFKMVGWFMRAVVPTVINIPSGVGYDDLVKGRVDVDFVARLERKNDSHTISNKTFDFSKTTIRQLIQDGYKETKEQMKGVLARGKN
jgi:hypothetical protein